MTLETLVAQYGYPALFIGAVLEGESVLLMAALLVQQGLMDPKGMVLASAMGAFVGDQFFFHLGRCKGPGLFRHKPTWQQKMNRAVAMLDRRRGVVVLSYRFIYGMRAVIPFLLGSGRCRAGTFCLLSFLSAIAWAALIGTGGYLLGEAFQRVLDRGRYLQVGVLTLGALIVISVMIWHRRRQRKRTEGDRQDSRAGLSR